jgi:hypothetical protein
MRFRIVPALAAIVIAACSQQAAPPPAAPVAKAPEKPAAPAPVVPTRDGHFLPEITAEDIAAHVQRLASDEFEGRKPGTIGERMTTTYLIDQFQRMGLKPGNKDSYLQRVPMVEATLIDADKITLDVAAGGGVEKFAYKTDTIVASLQQVADVEVKDSDIVFAGYGVVAPEYQWDDYAGLDVKGKTVVVLVNDPGFDNHDASLFRGVALTYSRRWPYQY